MSAQFTRVRTAVRPAALDSVKQGWEFCVEGSGMHFPEGGSGFEVAGLAFSQAVYSSMNGKGERVRNTPIQARRLRALYHSNSSSRKP